MMPGMISWNAHAYYTFHNIGKWDDRTRSGALNVFRYARSHPVLWYPSEMVDKPYIHIAGEWKEGIETLDIFSNGDEIELLVNDRSLGIFKPSNEEKYKGLDHPPYEINIDQYEEGKLTAKAISGGEVIAEQTIFTHGKPYAIKFTLDTDGRQFEAGGSDILVGYAEIVDKNGMVLRNYEPMVKFEIEGAGTIVGDDVDIKANPAKARLGCAPVLIRSREKPGKIKITAKSKGLKKASIEVTTVAPENDMMVAGAYIINDFEKVKIDLGAADQLLQFGWIPWNGVDKEKSKINVDALGGFAAEIKPVSNDGIIRWLGEMNVIGFNGFAYGEGVLAIDDKGLMLSFEDLPKGKYKLKSYHHAPRSNTNSMDPNKERLKTLKVHMLPYANVLRAEVRDVSGSRMVDDIMVTEGKERQYEKPGTVEITFEADGENPVEVIFADPKAAKGIWLNAFELMQQY